MPFNVPQIVILIIGLVLTFFGLSLYKTLIKLVGFVVGASYGIYLYSLLMGSLSWDPLYIYITVALIVLILGMMGIMLAQFANVVMFFLAGGMVGLIMGKILTGIPADQAMSVFSGENVEILLQPKASDLFWFLGGGIIFVIALDTLVMLSLTIAGAGLIWMAIKPMNLLEGSVPDWIIPVFLGFIGLMVQEANRKRRKPEAARIMKEKMVRKSDK
ncbi:MAG TPA: hypothetical protein VGB30_00590 [bacterium]|jgi:hypothetical protein